MADNQTMNCSNYNSNPSIHCEKWTLALYFKTLRRASTPTLRVLGSPQLWSNVCPDIVTNLTNQKTTFFRELNCVKAPTTLSFSVNLFSAVLLLSQTYHLLLYFPVNLLHCSLNSWSFSGARLSHSDAPFSLLWGFKLLLICASEEER